MSGQGHSQSQYAAATRAPLIKSPSIRVPPPVELPPDIHPLPASVTEYFAYPFTLEPHLLTVESSRRATLTAHAARRAALLKARDDEKDRRRRDALRRIAPGFEPEGAVLMPMRALGHDVGEGARAGSGSGTGTPEGQGGQGQGHQRSRSVMDDLVDQLAAMDSSRTATPGSVQGS